MAIAISHETKQTSDDPRLRTAINPSAALFLSIEMGLNS
jgi:hypothetical protein